jgi:hypothetical protein
MCAAEHAALRRLSIVTENDASRASLLHRLCGQRSKQQVAGSDACLAGRHRRPGQRTSATSAPMLVLRPPYDVVSATASVSLSPWLFKNSSEPGANDWIRWRCGPNVGPLNWQRLSPPLPPGQCRRNPTRVEAFCRHVRICEDFSAEKLGADVQSQRTCEKRRSARNTVEYAGLRCAARIVSVSGART